MKALVKREMKRYFASSIYVSNTLIGYVMMVAAAAALLVLGAESLEDMIGIEGLIEKGAPFVFAGLAGLGSTTANSISLEGKQWWILKSLPLKGRDILNGKLLVNLTIAAPFYLLTVILACIAIRQVASPSAYLWMILLPLLYILWMAVVGLSFNLRMPVMDWENEVTVVKQSAAAMLTVLVGFLSIGLPLLAVWAVPEPFSFWVTVLIAAALCCGIGILYHRMGKADLRNIE